MPEVFQEPHPNPRRPQVPVPPGACDCHAHLFGPPEIYPVLPDAGYAIPRAGAENYRRSLGILGLSRAVLVLPHVYGQDNRCLIDALSGSGGAWRGIAVIGPKVSSRELETMHRAGVRGVRINFRNEGGLKLADVTRVAERVAPLGWHLEFAAQGEHLLDVAECARKVSVDIVVPHMGRVPARLGIRHNGFQALLSVVRDGRCWVKLSAAHRFSSEPAPHRDVQVFVDALLGASTDRLLWATDWPHTRVRPTEYMPDDGDLLDQLAQWVPDAGLRNRILVDNPEKLYGFP